LYDFARYRLPIGAQTPHRAATAHTKLARGRWPHRPVHRCSSSRCPSVKACGSTSRPCRS
jgi:hypothetical protein